jgi:hypothetical protein
MKVGVMQPYFLPYFGYFQLINAVDVYVNLDHVSFMKRSYMVRNILKNDVKINLSVIKASHRKKCKDTYVDINDVFIRKFKNKLHHLYVKNKNYKTITNHIIEPCLNNQEVTVSRFNLDFIKSICVYLEIDTQIIDTSYGLTENKKQEGIIDIVKHFNGTEYINAIGGQNLYNKESFKKNNIDLHFLKMESTTFDNPFLSTLDIIFRYERKMIINNLKNYTLI